MSLSLPRQGGQAIRLLSLRHRVRAAELLAPLGLHPGQEALLLELDRAGPRIQAQLSQALGCEPPSVTLMVRKLEASGHVRRGPSPDDKRASVVELTESGRELAAEVKEVWCELADETVAGLPAPTAEGLPGLLNALTANVDTRRRPRQQRRQARERGERRESGEQGGA
ncbi:DNA-binding MarR family transcriptional regulator [Catenulispora sp. GP43]|uniref:MarR family winged helix-turn-helix transcriptional regulator n=1 Tax=Catenulispora sp. GP43 TaxID=3156263 RepID=UPI003516ADE2